MFQNLHPSLRNAFYLILFTFFAMLAATFHTLQIAFKDFEPVIDKNYYEIGLNYEQVIEDQKFLIAKGYALNLQIGDGAEILKLGKQMAKVTLLQNGKTAKANQVTLILERSATSKNAITYKFKEDKNGSFVSEIDLPGAGNWNTRTFADIEGKKMELQGLISAK